MSTIVFALLVATSQYAFGAPSIEPISPKAAAERVSRCGLGPVTIRYEDVLQSEVLIAQKVTTATDEQLACADRAASYYDLELPETLQPRYEAIRAERSAVLGRAEARQWLVKQGLLGRVPNYKKGITDEAHFTHEAEKLCGPRASGAFRSSYGPHIISPRWIERKLRPGNFDSKALRCLMNVAQAAGYEIGFIGNEAMQTEANGAQRK